MVEVYRSGTSYEAHLVHLALREQGLRSLVVGEALVGCYGEDLLGQVQPIAVVVPEDDATLAYRVLVDLRAILLHPPNDHPARDDADRRPLELEDAEGTFAGDETLPAATTGRCVSMWTWMGLLTGTFGLGMFANGEIVVLAMLVGLVVSMLVLPALGE